MQGRKLHNRFEIGASLGRGAQGEVYRLFDLELPEQQLIIKVFTLPQLAGQQDSHWINELQYAMGFSHPALLKIFDTGLFFPEKRPYYIAEYFDSKPLYHIFKDKLTVQNTYQLTTQLLSALAYLHRSSLLHMDIKPSNILLAQEPVTRVKLIDYGSVLELNVRRTSLRGTPHYLSPSVIRGHAARETDDLYALGVVLFQTLNGLEKISSIDIEEWIGQIRLGWHPFAASDFEPCGIFKPFIKALLWQKYGSAEQAQRELHELLSRSMTSKTSDHPGELFFSKLPFANSQIKKMRCALDDIFSGRSKKKAILISGPRGVGKSSFCRDVAKNYANHNGIMVETLSGISGNSAFAAFRQLAEHAEALQAFSGIDPFSANQVLASASYRSYFFSIFCEAVVKIAERSQKLILIFEAAAARDLYLFELLLKVCDFAQEENLQIAVIILINSEQKYDLKTKQLIYENCYLHKLLENAAVAQIFLPAWTEKRTARYLQTVFGKIEQTGFSRLATMPILKTPGSLREFLENAYAQGSLSYRQGRWAFRKKTVLASDKQSEKDFLKAVIPYLPEPIHIQAFAALFKKNPALCNAFVELVQDKLLVKDEDRYFWTGGKETKTLSAANERLLKTLAAADPIHLLPLCKLVPNEANAKLLLEFLETYEGTDQYLPHEQVIECLLQHLHTPELKGALLYHLGRILSIAGRLNKASTVLRRADKTLHAGHKLRFLNYIELVNVYAKQGQHQKAVHMIDQAHADDFSAEQKNYLNLLKLLAECLSRGPGAFPCANLEMHLQQIHDPFLRGRFSLRYSQALLWAGQEDHAEQWITLTISIFQKPLQPIRLARALRMKAKILRNRGFTEKALEATEEALALLKSSFSFPREELETLVSLFYLQKRLGGKDLLQGYLCRIFALLPLLRNSRYELLWPELLAQSRDDSQPEEALRHFRTQERMARSMKSPRHLYIALTNQAMLEMNLGDRRKARKTRDKAEKVFKKFGRKFPHNFQKYHRSFLTEKF